MEEQSLERVYYRIGDLVFELISDLPYPIEFGPSQSFRIAPEKPDYTYRLFKGQSMPEFIGDVTVKDSEGIYCELVNAEGTYFRSVACSDQFFDTAVRLESDGGQIMYLSYSLLAERFKRGFDPTNLFALEHVFFERGGMILHSSHVNVKGKALLFSAPSGTGKSTQADLWAEYEGAKVMNGDRTLLRKKEGVWTAYGCPMCGTSNIHQQGSEPIYAIVMLEQGKENCVQKLSAGEAFSLIYPQITVPKWKRELVFKAMELIDDLIASIPIYKYSCTKDKDAVTILKRELDL